MNGSPNEAFRRQDEIFFGALQAARFDDPRLEGYRRSAVRDFQGAATQNQGFWASLVDSLGAPSPAERWVLQNSGGTQAELDRFMEVGQ